MLEEQSNSSAPAKLEASDIHKIFQISTGFMKPKQKLHAVNGVSFSVQKGETVGIVGESGCGKSTLAEILLGLQQPTSGEVKLNGQSLHDISRNEIASVIQPVFQDPFSSLNPRKTIRAIITLPLKVNTKLSAKSQNEIVEKIFAAVGLPKAFLRRLPHQLSGGQRQRVAIARALVLRPEILVLDEPTSALDVSAQAQILNLLKDMQSDFALTYLLVSHDLSVIEYMADRVIVFYLGKIVETAKTEDIFNDPKHPYTRALMASVMTPEVGKGISDAGIGTAFPNPADIPKGCAFHPRCPIAQDRCAQENAELRKVGNSLTACLLAEDNTEGKL